MQKWPVKVISRIGKCHFLFYFATEVTVSNTFNPSTFTLHFYLPISLLRLLIRNTDAEEN